MFEDWDDWGDDDGEEPGEEPGDWAYPDDEGYEYIDADQDYDPYDEYREQAWDPWGLTP